MQKVLSVDERCDFVMSTGPVRGTRYVDILTPCQVCDGVVEFSGPVQVGIDPVALHGVPCSKCGRAYIIELAKADESADA